MKNEQILAIDIGGTSIKATVLNTSGEMLVEYQKVPTPEKASPENVIKAIKKLIADFPSFDKISVGFPGYVKKGVIVTAPNLGTSLWAGCNLALLIAKELHKPVRLLNDADMQGFGLISGEGLEMVITLGTGFGTALFMDGSLLPHLELAHLPVRKNLTYDKFIGDDALIEDGLEEWNKNVKDVLKTFKTVINYDKLYLSGGNAKKITFKLDDHIKIARNRDGIKGGAFMWQKDDDFCVQSVNP
ncbi:ROK family protein [Pedobacter glucosidilyticus]|uniref:ROK family protein n=1 Tax=Pedobacter glucosidilyticus TaxID=1122941 RepID=UPI0004159C38|nr:ROK family protein [Pedobacter glucosidilyticus]